MLAVKKKHGRFIGGLRVLTTKTVAGDIQSVEISHTSPSGEGPLIIKTGYQGYQNDLELTIDIKVKRKDSFNFELSEKVIIKNELQPAAVKQDKLVFNQTIIRSGIIQIASPKDQNLVVYQNNQIQTTMYSEAINKPKDYQSLISITDSKENPAGFFVNCGLPQGQSAFANSASDSGEEIPEIKGALFINGQDVLDQSSNRHYKLKGLCEGSVQQSFDHLEELINQKLIRYFGKPKINGGVDLEDRANKNDRNNQKQPQKVGGTISRG